MGGHNQLGLVGEESATITAPSSALAPGAQFWLTIGRCPGRCPGEGYREAFVRFTADDPA